jgi:uncharacterized membrane protein YebE (DUF533 family)
MKGRVIMNNKLEELLSAARLGELLHKKEAEKDKTSHTVLMVLAIIGAVAAVAAIAYAVYRYLTPDYLEDFEDDFDDDFDDDFVDNDTETNATSVNSTASADKATAE